MNTTPRTQGSAVVARFMDGRVVKGTTYDFAPHKLVFHLTLAGDPSGKTLTVPRDALKALFFVRTFDGNPKHIDGYDLSQAKTSARKLAVTFDDGEVLCGASADYSPGKPVFFITPFDTQSNNIRVFVVAAAARKIAYIEAGTPSSIGA